MKSVSPDVLKPQLTSGVEIAFLDVREHGQYGEGHPFFSVNAPYSTLEFRIPFLVPRKSTTIVVMDDDDGVARKAGHVLEGVGYQDVLLLEGGAPGWAKAGYTLFKGVNLPSKTYGELVEHANETPSISADELKAWMDRGAPVRIFDGRPGPEYMKMSIPTAQSCPNAELAYRIPSLAIDPETPIVVNCAGRTRSIIGAETLRQCGFKGPIFALRNGTQGWALAGLKLNHGIQPGGLPSVEPGQLSKAAEIAGELIERLELELISPAKLEAWQSDPARTTYLFDVRTQDEYDAGHLPGARHAPGGQLVQATDEFLAVRGARIVLCDNTGLRAATTAMWLRGMGHNVCILDADASQATSKQDLNPDIEVDALLIGPADAARQFKAGAIIVDASRSMDYRDGHPNGANWITRAHVNRLDYPLDQPVIVTGRDVTLIAGVAAELKATGFANLHWFEGTKQIWREAGFEIVRTTAEPADPDCIDFLFFVHDRHDGNLDAARRYLSWETGLLEQLDDQERSVLQPPQSHPANAAD